MHLNRQKALFYGQQEFCVLLTPPVAALCSERLRVGKKKINSEWCYLCFFLLSNQINWDDKVLLWRSVLCFRLLGAVLLFAANKTRLEYPACSCCHLALTSYGTRACVVPTGLVSSSCPYTFTPARSWAASHDVSSHFKMTKIIFGENFIWGWGNNWEVGVCDLLHRPPPGGEQDIMASIWGSSPAVHLSQVWVTPNLSFLVWLIPRQLWRVLMQWKSLFADLCVGFSQPVENPEASDTHGDCQAPKWPRSNSA